MSSVRRSQTRFPARVGTTIRTERSATSARGRPRVSARTRCSSNGPTTRDNASDDRPAARNDSVADLVETAPAVRDLFERRRSDRDGLRSHVRAAEVFVETAGGRVVAQDPYDHVPQLHLPQRSGPGTHKLAAVALALCAVADIDRLNLAPQSRPPPPPPSPPRQ